METTREERPPVRVRADLHRRLKLESVLAEVEMGEIADVALEAELARREQARQAEVTV
jgi:hypothetical protein